MWWEREDVDRHTKMRALAHPAKPHTWRSFATAVPKASAEYGKYALDRTKADTVHLYRSVVGHTSDELQYLNEDTGKRAEKAVVQQSVAHTKKGVEQDTKR